MHFVLLALTLFFTANASTLTLDVISKVKSCTFAIFSSSENFNKSSSFYKKSLGESISSNASYGTGFLTSYKNTLILLTNFHVVESPLKNKNKIFACNSEGCFEFVVSMIDKERDVAILKQIENFAFKCKEGVKFLPNPSQTSEIFIFGNKFGLGNSFAFGHLASPFHKISENEKYHIIDVNAGYGNSGGAVFSFDGSALGMLKSIYLNNANQMVFAISTEDVIKSIEKMQEILDFADVLEFEIKEEGDDIFLVKNNESLYFEKLPFQKVRVQSINKKFVSSKAEVLYDIYQFVNNGEEEVLRLGFASLDGKLKTLNLRKNRRESNISVIP